MSNRVEAVAKEKEAFLKIKPDLMKEHVGKHVLFQGGEVRGIYNTHKEAYAEALKRYGLDTPFLLEELVLHPPTTSLNWELGLFNAQR